MAGRRKVVKVRMLVSMAGPHEAWAPGDIREVPRNVADEWARLGIAEILEAREVERAVRDRADELETEVTAG